MTLISEGNNWALLSIMFFSSFIAIYLEQKYKWAAKSYSTAVAECKYFKDMA